MEEDAAGGPRYSAAADWTGRRGGAANGVLTALDRANAVAETPVAAATRAAGLNPLHHTGPIAVFLFIVAFATGVYVTMFFRFGFDASYTAVEQLEASVAGRFMRAAHRYSSIALVIVSIVHGWRTLVMRRFQKPRRTAWVTGVVMVIAIWLIGVTGYWMIWDQRAQVLNEALRRVLAGTGAGLDFMIDNVLTGAAGTGWPFILLLFLVHFLLSAAIAVLIWYHLRHLARPAWVPTPFWTALIGGSLVVASIAFPLGMLPPVDITRLLGRVDFDPFYLFLMPVATQWSPGLLWGGTALVAALAIGLPWLVLRHRPGPAEVLPDRCVGCTWCAVDCPYDAIAMVPAPESEHLQVAVIEPGRCVSCGICLGSCPAAAVALGGLEPRSLWDELAAIADAGAGGVVVSCQRTLPAAPDSAVPVITVPCVGMVAPALLEAGVDRDLTIELVGCPTADCSFREGSEHTHDRLAGRRPPRLRNAYAGAHVSMSTAAAGRFFRRRPVDAGSTRSAARRLLPLIGLIGLVAVGSVLVSRAGYDAGESDRAAVIVALDHRAGVPLIGDGAVDATPTGAAPQLTIVIDGEVRRNGPVDLFAADAPNTALLWERLFFEPGAHEIRVELADGPFEPGRVLFAGQMSLEAGETLFLDYRDQEVVVASEAGREIFNGGVRGVRSGCAVCHSLRPGVELVGPSLAGVATRAAESVPGLDAAAYLRQSIVDPDAYVVPGFPAGQMLPDFASVLEDDEIEYLVAFLLTLEDG